MKNISCVITKESSTLKAEISTQMEIVLHLLLLTSIVAVLQNKLNEVAVEIINRLFKEMEAIWVRKRPICNRNL